jgi:hypothetical protein
MPDPALSQALAEAYASAPADEVWLQTLEIWHPSFTAPIRVVHDNQALEARLEASAARDAGALVTFTPYAFRVVKPELTAEQLAECAIEIDNTSREIGRALDAAVVADGAAVVVYREYLLDAALAGPGYDPPLVLTLRHVRLTPEAAVVTAGFPDLLNRTFPAEEYDLDRFPGLAE